MRSTIVCRLVTLPSQRAVTVMRQQLTQPSYLAHALGVNKPFHKKGVFGHRANLIFGGSRRGLEVFIEVEHSTLFYKSNTEQ